MAFGGEELQPVADAIARVKAAASRDLGRIGPLDRIPSGHKGTGCCVNIDDERRVSSMCGAEVLLDTHVQLSVGPTEPGDLEPAATASRQQRWFR